MKRIVTIGGGTGTFTVLTGLKKYPVDLSAVVAMSDNGGSSGRLRDEFGVLPPGDVRQCLVALSESGAVMRDLFNHRYEKGDLKGHNFGNIFISTLEQVTGSLDKALDVIGEILKIRGRVLPVTFTPVHLRTELKNGKVIKGEHELEYYQLLSKFGIKKMSLHPEAVVNPKAITAIKQADLIVIGPGSLYESLIPNFLVPGVGNALAKSKAKKVFIVNLMNRHGHTDDFTVMDYVRTIEEKIGKTGILDYVIYNTSSVPKPLLRKYADEGDPVVEGPLREGKTKFIGTDLLSSLATKKQKTDTLYRSLVRHDPDKLAATLMSIVEGKLR